MLVPVARVGTIQANGRPLKLTRSYRGPCSFYRETDVGWLWVWLAGWLRAGVCLRASVVVSAFVCSFRVLLSRVCPVLG